MDYKGVERLQQNILDLQAEIRELELLIKKHTRELSVLKDFIKDVAECRDFTSSKRSDMKAGH